MKLALVALLLVAPAVAATPTLSSPCNDWLGAGTPVDTSCPAPIHPGAHMDNGCTLAWIVTDGTDLYAMTAGHCAGWDHPLYVDGVDHAVGTLAYHGPDYQPSWQRGGNDSSFFVINAADRALVDGSLQQFGGPKSSSLSPIGSPLPGQPLVQYGWGVATSGVAEARGRPGVTLYAYPTDHQVIWASAGVSGGDSGSPIMTADGQAVGITSAAIFGEGAVCILTGVCAPVTVDPTAHVVFGVSLTTEMASFSQQLGKPLTLVTGKPMLST